MKQLLILILLMSLSIFSTVSCTSSNDMADGDEIVDADGFEDGSELDNFEDAELDGDFSSEEFADDGGLGGDDFSDEFADDSSGEDMFMDEGDESFASDDAPQEEAVSDFASEDAFGSDDTTSGMVTDISGSDEDSYTSFDSTTDSFADTSEPLTDDTDLSYDSASPGFAEMDSTTSFSDSTEDIARTWVPVKKIASAPFNKGGQLLNTVYIVRPDDTLETVSQKIYGSDRSADILAANPHLNRSFTTGDKLYYNSPNRPSDSSQMLTYYEDVGIPAQAYITQEGDNIRNLGTVLLGNPNSWKELWATNMNVDSKGDVSGGIELRYFPEGGAPTMPPPSQTIAQNETLPPPDMGMEPTMNDLPPPPDMMGAGTVEPPPPPPMEPPPPPPPPAMEPPPPPPVENRVAQTDSGKGMNMKLILAACLLIGGGLAIVILQKNKSKKINIGETQI